MTSPSTVSPRPPARTAFAWDSYRHLVQMFGSTVVGEAEFFSFGTNDLPQTTWGFSREDVEAAFSAYLDRGILTVSPVEPIDREGVGRLVQIAVAEGRAARPELKIGVCREHGGYPDSVHFFQASALDYVSCSPFRVPVARLEAGRAALPQTEAGESR